MRPGDSKVPFFSSGMVADGLSPFILVSLSSLGLFCPLDLIWSASAALLGIGSGFEPCDFALDLVPGAAFIVEMSLGDWREVRLSLFKDKFLLLFSLSVVDICVFDVLVDLDCCCCCCWELLCTQQVSASTV